MGILPAIKCQQSKTIPATALIHVILSKIGMVRIFYHFLGKKRAYVKT
jgi:hypothetical protein